LKEEMVKSSAGHKNLPENIRRAKVLRQSGSVIEKILWNVLRLSREQKEIKFRYQHPLRPYIVDFVCLPARLVVEIDGPSHDASSEKDQCRQKLLEDKGYMIVRFSNADVLNDVHAVASTIRQKAKELLQHRWNTDPSPKSPCDFDPPARGGCLGGY
jgi:very-short-patch-repair endonuclease